MMRCNAGRRARPRPSAGVGLADGVIEAAQGRRARAPRAHRCMGRSRTTPSAHCCVLEHNLRGFNYFTTFPAFDFVVITNQSFGGGGKLSQTLPLLKR